MSSVWDEFKDLFKTKSQKEEEKQNELKSALESEGTLDDRLDQLDKAYRDYENSQESGDEEEDLEKLFPSRLDLQELEYAPKTEEELSAQAESEQKTDKETDINEAEADYGTSLEKLDGKKTDAEKTLNREYAELENVYGDLKKKAVNGSIKNGMARSSVLKSGLNDLENEKTSSAEEVKAAYDDAMSSITGEIDKLEAKREQALGELDLKYASKIEKRISELRGEQEETAAKYVKYNNTVREKQAEYSAQRAKNVQQYLADKAEDETAAQNAARQYEAANGYSGEKQSNYAQRYGLAYDFYSSLSPEIAADALEASPNMKYYLGNYYATLLTAMKSRQSDTKKYY